MPTSLMKLISDEEMQAMNKYRRFYAYSDYTATSKEERLEYILRYWQENKSKYLFNLLGNKLIYSKTIKYERSASELIDEFYQKLDIEFDNPLKNFREYFIQKAKEIFTVPVTDLSIIDNNYKTQDYWICMHLLEPTTLANNKADIDYDLFLNDKKIHIQPESKPVKIIKKIVTALDLDEELFEKFRLAHSMIFNERKITGELCISIHPFDYMTMSDNDSDWESCMSWMNEGCYRRGTVEMMNSSSVVVAYLKSAHDTEFCGLDWNNKKWRQLFIVTEDFAIGVKGYPFHNLGLEAEVLKTISELAKENLGWEYYNQLPEFAYGDHDSEIKIDDEKSFKVDFFFETYYMYNDFDCGINNLVLISTKFTEDADIRHNYSGPAVCMCCGAVDGEYYDDEAVYLVCDNCGVSAPEPIGYCAECGEEIYESTDYISLNSGYYLCSCCGANDEYYFRDPLDGRDYPTTEGEYIYLVDDSKPCQRRFFTGVPLYNITVWTKYFEDVPTWYRQLGMYCIDKKECNPEGLKLFKKY